MKKKVFLAFLFAAMLALPVMAEESKEPMHPKGDKGEWKGEGHGPGGPFEGKRMKRLIKELELTADQQAKVKSIFEGRKAEFTAFREEMRKKMEGLKDQVEKDIKALLTAEQSVKFDKMTKNMEEKMGKRREKMKERMEKRMGRGRHEMNDDDDDGPGDAEGK